MLINASLRLYKNTAQSQFCTVKRIRQVMLLISILLCSSWAQADGLFDFQMKLAKKGNAEAEFKIGEMYETGFGVKKDLKAAKIWITKAAKQGHENAGFKLLYWDIEKNGVKGESKKLFAELRTKANDNNEQAMYYFGKMYAYGIGVKKNYDTSLKWLNKAAFVGVLEAEREAVFVRDLQQKAVAEKRKAVEQNKLKQKEKEQLEARSAEEAERKKLEAQKKAESEKKSKAEAEKKRNQAFQVKKEAQKEREMAIAAEKKEKARKIEQEKLKAEAARKKQIMKQRAAEKKKKEQKKKDKESKFESDPCSGKSARFLSTCR